VSVRRHLGLLYVVLTLLLIAMAVWWVILLTQEVQARAAAQLQKLESDRMQAAFLLQASPEMAADPAGRLGDAFPHLRYRTTADSVAVLVAPEVAAQIRADARRRRNMMVWEGGFFLALIAAGSGVLLLAHRREQDLDRTRALFLAGVTHEFKTPLASLRLYAETLARPDLDDQTRAGIRERVVDDAKRLESLVNQVLALSDEEAFRQEPRRRLDLGQECRTVLSDLGGFVADRRAQIRSDLPAGHFILGQPLTLHLVLRNLIHNAVRHGGASPVVTITLQREADWHRLAVGDDGPGIARRLHKKVFECFYSGGAGRDQSGTGLGLYLVKRNVETLGGRVELESDEQRGATFTVVLPVYAGDKV
jgi:two-component system phosphate regulon sensor histidine kinase PhoR